ncbi:sensor histidine kinase [Streptomyces sp. WM6378]|uniref:sensor histidine kinase n=1 Tax=Streptomyces sp. WM6378 TaxID=1415557 RepID=UPI0006B04A40|nr:histidine kinase [Streptomyces sp. WM6378]
MDRNPADGNPAARDPVAQGHRVPGRAAGRALPRRTAIAITAGVLLGFFVIDGSHVWAEHPSVWHAVAAVLGFAAIMGLQLVHSFPGFILRLGRYRYATWVLQGLLAYLPIIAFGAAWGGMTEFFAASAVLVLPAALGWPLFACAVAGELALFGHFGFDAGDFVYGAIEAVLIPLVVIGLSRMSDMIDRLHASREELSRLAVAGERLRFARDLHEVLGLSLSAISLKCELAYRLLADAPEKAYDEVGEVLRTSRKALADVRSVSRGYRQMSLSDEANAAVSMLSAAGIDTTVRHRCGELPAPVDTVLATALGEGLTNMLRHSKAERCVITTECGGGVAVLVLGNDGAGRGRTAGPEPGSGLAALDSRLRELGGTLTHGADGRGWFRLRAVVPLRQDAQAPRPRRRTSATGDRSRAARPGRTDMMPRAAGAITLAVLVGYFLSYSAEGWSYAPYAHGLPTVELCLLGCLALQLAESFHRRFAWGPSWKGRLRYGALGAQALLQFVPFLVFGEAWAGIPGFLAGSALLALPAVAAWPVLVLVTVASDAAQYAVGVSTQDVIYETAYTPICAVVVFGLTRMAQLATELHRSRAEIARLAVTTERLRFARDLHDLLGFSLSAITLKCELVRRLAPTRPVQARRELTEVLGIVHEALADVRTVAGGSRRMCLSAEAEHAMAMLAGAGIHATVRLDCGELPGDVETVLATLVREGLTNMLRHSRPECCEITAERTAGAVRLSLVNDGADRSGDPSLASRLGGGSGIGNLTTRVEAVNGRLTAGPRPDGRFELRAEVELLAA